MTKEEKKRYDRHIDEVADSLMMSAYKKALEIMDDVYLDILLRLRAKADAQIGRLGDRKEIKGL